MNDKITDFRFYWIFRKCPNFYVNGVCTVYANKKWKHIWTQQGNTNIKHLLEKIWKD